MTLAAVYKVAIISKMPNEAIIGGFKGVVDYYYYMGVPCARRWPSSPGHRRAPAVMATWSAFAYASREWNNLSPTVRDAYAAMAPRSGLSARDVFARAYLKGLYRLPTGP